jgi:hypothetical protein
MNEDFKIVRELTLSNEVHRYIKTVEVFVTFAAKDGSINTLEGEVPYLVGDAIMTGVRGEHWPIERKNFDEWYRAVVGKLGYYLKSKTVLAKQMHCAFRVPVTTNEPTYLTGKAGDWAVQTSPGNLGVVSAEIFDKTYKLVLADTES